MEFERINPLTQEPASKATAMSPAEARAVADRAANAFPSWSTLGPNARRALLTNAATALEARKLGVQIAFALMYTVIALTVLLSAAWIGLGDPTLGIGPKFVTSSGKKSIDETSPPFSSTYFFTHCDVIWP